jgi:hypothetical protein
MSKLSYLVKKAATGIEEYFFGVENYISNPNNQDSFDILIGKVALTSLTILGVSTIISGILYPEPSKYEWGATTITLSELFRCNLQASKERYSNKKP